MPLAAIGGLRPHPGIVPGLAFTCLAGLSLIQARRAQGSLGARVTMRDGMSFSLSLWSDPVAMKRFAASRMHGVAMRRAGQLATDWRFYVFAADAMPDWDEAIWRWHLAGDLRQHKFSMETRCLGA